MPSRFAELQADMAAIVTDEFGEPTEITFADVHPYLIQPDTNLSHLALGVVTAEDVVLDRSGRRQDGGAWIKSTSVEARYATADLATALRKPRSGDKIRLMDRAGAPLYRVVDGNDNGRGRWVCTLEPVHV